MLFFFEVAHVTPRSYTSMQGPLKLAHEIEVSLEKSK